MISDLAINSKIQHFNDLMQKRCNSIANALELHLFGFKPSMQSYTVYVSSRH